MRPGEAAGLILIAGGIILVLVVLVSAWMLVGALA